MRQVAHSCDLLPGKHRSHYRKICGLSFTYTSGEPPAVQSISSAVTASVAVAVTTGSQSFASRPIQLPPTTVSPHLYDKGYPRLFSVGEDRRLVEYDVPNSFEHTGNCSGAHMPRSLAWSLELPCHSKSVAGWKTS